MSDEKRLASSIIQFLGEQLRSDELTADDKEGLDVAIQCLESVYKISSSDVHLLPSRSLINIFRDAIQHDPIVQNTDEPLSEDARKRAEELKVRGNELMKSEWYKEALDSYTDAIKLDPKNAVFYCNRAAAYSKLNQHGFAIEDCKRAIEIDPNYSKAYGRMGLAYSNMDNHYQAKESFKKALDLDPSNESYGSNLKVAEDSIREMEARNPWANFLNNPAIANVAQQLLHDPNLQNFVGSMMNTAFSGMPGGPPGGAPPSSSQGESVPGSEPQGGAPGASGGGFPFNMPFSFGMPPSGAPSAATAATAAAAPGGTPSGAPDMMAPGFDTMVRVGQQWVNQIAATNPELIEQLRGRFSASMNSGDNNNTNNSNPNNDSQP